LDIFANMDMVQN